MKKIYFILYSFFFFLFIFSSYSQDITLGNGSNSLLIEENTYNNLRLNFSLSVIRSADIVTDNGIYSRLTVDGYTGSYDTGNPNLPVLRKLIEVAVNANTKINIIKSQAKEYSLKDLGINHPLMPSQPPVSKDSTKRKIGFVFNTTTYSSDKYYNTLTQGHIITSEDGSPVSVDYLGIMRGINIARLNISPISYNPVTGKIKVYTNIEINITFENADINKTMQLKQLAASPYFNSSFNSLINYKPLNLKSNIPQSPVKFVIVSDPMFRDSLQGFIQWKIKKGFKVIEAYTDNPAVGNTAVSIQTYLKNLYNNSTTDDPPPSFLLIVGDITQVPSFRGTASQNYYYTDLPYCDFTGDYLPEMFYGRFSANNLTELMPQINKTLEYEQYLMPDPSYLANAVLIAGYDVSYSWLYANGQMNYASHTYFNPSGGFNTFYAKYPDCANDVSLIKQKINAGAGYVNYSAHGMWYGWVNPAFQVTDISSLTNKDKYGLIVGNACYTQGFDKSECFGEGLLRAADKGSIGYIGAFSETYWDEDFWWSVGFCNIDTFPLYGQSKSLGAYDRLFHNHKESFGDWYITQGQMLSGGNISVTESGSPECDYYWENYSLMGDPSVMPFLSIPAKLKIQFNKLVPVSINFVHFVTEPFTYIAISRNDTLFGAAMADSNGIVNVNISDIKSQGKAVIVATRQNRIPYIDTITFTRPDNSYLTFNFKRVNKSKGSNDGQVDYADFINLDINLKNIGTSDAENVKAILRTNDKFIILIDSVSKFGNININDSVTIPSAFSFLVDSLIPDGHSADFNLLITNSSGNQWTSYFNIILNAPAFQFQRYIIQDSLSGNKNKKLDPGETADIVIPTINIGHTVADNLVGMLTSLNSHITINNTSVPLGNLLPSATAFPAFNVSVDKNITPGTAVDFTYFAISGSYIYIKDITVIIGSAIEDFESGNFKKFKWVVDTVHPWIITDTMPYEGIYCAHSAYFSGSGSSVLSISFNVNENDTISFMKRVYSDTLANVLQFFMDDDLGEQWTGNLDWSRSAYAVPPGYHTFQWTFLKYESEPNYYNCAWLDNIVFPHSTDLVSGISNLHSPFSILNSQFEVYPNPFSSSVYVSFTLQSASSVSLRLYDYLGQEKLVILNNSQFSIIHTPLTLNLDLSSFASGFYFLILDINNKPYSQKIIKL